MGGGRLFPLAKAPLSSLPLPLPPPPPFLKLPLPSLSPPPLFKAATISTEEEVRSEKGGEGKEAVVVGNAARIPNVSILPKKGGKGRAFPLSSPLFSLFAGGGERRETTTTKAFVFSFSFLGDRCASLPPLIQHHIRGARSDRYRSFYGGWVGFDFFVENWNRCLEN